MIYRALVELAEREELLQDVSYEPQPVHFLLALGEDGELLEVLEPRDPPRTDKKGRPVGKPPAVRRLIPRRSDRTAQDRAEFLVDKAEYVFGIDPDDKTDPGDKRKLEKVEKKLANRRRLFREAVERARACIPGSRSLRAVERFLLNDPPERIRALLKAEKEAERIALAGALFAFVYQPGGGAGCVHDEPEVKGYFGALLDSEEEPLIGQCLVSGDKDVSLTRLHAKPKGIPPKGKTKGGVPLTSVNAEAFKSYEMDALGCAPVSRKANIAIEFALNRLLDAAYPRPSGGTFPKRHVQISPDTVLVYWTRREAALDFMSAIGDIDPEEVCRLLRSPFNEFSAPLDDPTAFYALVLSGTTGRAIIRSFIETTVRDVAANVERYRREAEIVRPFGEAPGGYPLRELLGALVPIKDRRPDLEKLPPALGTDLCLCILSGRPFPRAVLDAAVRRNRVGDVDPSRLGARASLLKAYFVRNRKETIAVTLDTSRDEPAYQLGRLLAAADKIQQEALGSVNATLVDRYFGGASSTPAAVFPTLLRRNQVHLAKLRREKPGLAVNREKLVQEIASHLGSFPSTLGLESQGLFALGFYHQRQDFFAKKEEA